MISFTDYVSLSFLTLTGSGSHLRNSFRSQTTRFSPVKVKQMELVLPAAQYLESYIQALQRGWSPDNLRPEAATEELARIEADRDRFLSEQIDREAQGPP